MEGTDFEYKQALTFLPQWARGVQVFANLTAIRATGDSTASFSNYQPRVYNWDVSLSRPKFNFRANWNYRGVRRGAAKENAPKSDPRWLSRYSPALTAARITSWFAGFLLHLERWNKRNSTRITKQPPSFCYETYR